MRVTVKDILQAVIANVTDCIPEAEPYKGRLEEGFSLPAFLFIPTYIGETKANYFTAKRNLEIQMIYFGRDDGYKREDYEERLEVESRLMPFLSQFRVQVGDRHLPFTYEIKEADNQLAIYLTFRYLDEAIDQRYTAAADMEPAYNVSVNNKTEGKD